MKKTFSYAILMLLFVAVPLFAGVSISKPYNGSTVGSPVNFVASATGCYGGVSSMGVYINNQLRYKVGGANLNTSMSLAAGYYNAAVVEWDHCGGSAVARVGIHVTSSSPGVGATTPISISSPSNGEHVSSPFTLSASASSCQSKAVRTIGYSLDNSPDTTLFPGSTTLDTKVSESLGTHIVHVKSWNTSGAVCVAEVGIDVTYATDNTAAATVPSSSTNASSLQTLGNWRAMHDGATSGWSSGYMSLVGSPAHSGSARRFTTKYSNWSGERYSITFGDDRTSQNFLWDGWVYLTSSASSINSLEMDLDQTMSNGQTVVFGFQCDGSSGTWDYSANAGSAANPRGYWKHSNVGCNPRNWSKYRWHHVQISYSRTTNGWLTYKSVTLDGVQKTLNAKVFGARDMGWGSSLTINFQVDGLGGSGSSTVYLDDLTLKRW